MEENNYPEKSYRLFYLWLIGFVTVMFAAAALSGRLSAVCGRDVSMKLTLSAAFISLSALMLIIYFTERVYYLNGTSYGQAKAAGSERRKAFARDHLRVFVMAFIGWLLWLIVSFVFHTAFWLDAPVFAVFVVSAAFSTMKFRL